MTCYDDVAFSDVPLGFIFSVFVFLTQQNHETLMSLYRDMETGTYIPNSAGSSWNARKKEEKELIDHLLDHFAKTRPAYSKNKVR